MNDFSVIYSEEMNDNVKYIQSLILLSACKEMHKIQINNIFFIKNIFFRLESSNIYLLNSNYKYNFAGYNFAKRLIKTIIHSK